VVPKINQLASSNDTQLDEENVNPSIPAVQASREFTADAVGPDSKIMTLCSSVLIRILKEI
jgi:hypothetical protein